MNILVTGGLGFIGSHTVVELIKNDHNVIIADNLVNSKVEVLDKISRITGVEPLFCEFDVAHTKETEDLFISHKINGVSRFVFSSSATVYGDHCHESSERAAGEAEHIWK